jgi:hypothetical protein
MREDERIIISIDLPKGERLAAAVKSVARNMSEDEDDMEDGSGFARSEAGNQIPWRVSRPADGVAIDPRQREAAALLLTAIDTPVEAMAWCRSLMEATMINPGMTVKAMPPRLTSLEEARSLIDEMIAEADGAKGPDAAQSTRPDASEPKQDDGILVLRTFHLTPEEDAAVSRIAFGRNMSREDLVVEAVRRLLAETSE